MPSWEVSQQLNIPTERITWPGGCPRMGCSGRRRYGGSSREGGCTQDSVGLPVLTAQGMLTLGQGLQRAEWEG